MKRIVIGAQILTSFMHNKNFVAEQLLAHFEKELIEIIASNFKTERLDGIGLGESVIASIKITVEVE